jgi:mono/diheme cytochrome c family protein
MRHLFALLASLLLASPVGAQSQKPGTRPPAPVDRPDQIFMNYCSVCHGEKGDGKSNARFSLNPPPADFTSDQIRGKISRAHMIETVKKGARTAEGRPTAMQSWAKQLSDAHIEAVVDYVIVKFMNGQVAADESQMDPRKHVGHDHSHTKHVDYPFGLKADAQRGKSVYAANCVGCHGDKGNGKGELALAKKLQPRNFQERDFREFATGFSLYSAVSRGNGHMPELEKSLSKQEIADVSEYVLREFIKPRRMPGRSR